MELKERTPKGILIKYVVTTLILWILALGIFVGLLRWGWESENSVAQAFMPLLGGLAPLLPTLIADKSARVALSNFQIEPSEERLSKLTSKVIVINIVLYNLPFVFLFFWIDEFFLWLVAWLIVNISAFLSTFWKFKPQKTKLTPKIENIENDVIERDEAESIININMANIPEFKYHPTKTTMKRSYEIVVAATIVFIFLGLLISSLLDQFIWFFIITFLSPTLGFGAFYYRKNYYKFKKNPIPLEIEHGHHLTKMVFRTNLIFLLVLVGFVTVLAVASGLDGDTNATPRFWIILGLMWLFFIFSFLPLFIISHLYFQKLERDALDAGRIVKESAIDLKRLKLKGKKTDERLKAFFIEIGLGNINYLVGMAIGGMNIDHTVTQQQQPGIIAFNDTDVYLFSYVLGSSKINLDLTFPSSTMTILRILKHKNERRVEFIVGDSRSILFIATVNKKGFNHQEEMFKRFIDLQVRKVDNDDVTGKY